MSTVNKSPVIIVGAGRSGTNMLRDLLVSHPQFVTWPCDEINYIWRHGNRAYPTDQFSRTMATESVRRFIKRQFAAFAKPHPNGTIVEKTCANSLRCGFVHEVFPDARFVHIIRDGRDVAASASLRWNAKLDLPYLMKKARYVPWSDLPYYGFSYLYARVYRLFSGKKRLATWGPRFDGMERAFLDHELPVGCAIQWRECVAASIEQLDEVPPAQVLTLRYEDFVGDPMNGLRQLFAFLNADATEPQITQMAKNVSSRSVGKWQSQLGTEQIEAIQQVAGELLGRLGYQ